MTRDGWKFRSAAGEHLSEAVTGAPGAMDYLAARFAGQPVAQNCSSIPAG